MDLLYTDSLEDINWEHVSQIFEIVGWGKRPSERVEFVFHKSTFVRFAYLNGELIGVGRTVDDGAFYGWIVDLAVLPEYQGRGIGTKILCDLENDLKPFFTTMLTAAPGKGAFYEKLGWHKQHSAYIWPRSEQQKRDFS